MNIYQINLIGDSATIVNSLTLIDTSSIVDTGSVGDGVYDMTYSIQLSSNGKIYSTNAHTYHLGAIDKPNILGTSCNYFDSAVYLNGSRCELGLPEFISSYFYDSFVSISDLSIQEDKIICYPNPFNTSTTIVTNSEQFLNCNAILYDIFGNEVRKIQLKNQRTNIERGNLSAGIYLLHIQYNNQTFSQKLVITDFLDDSEFCD